MTPKGRTRYRKGKDLIILLSHPGRLQNLDILVGAIALIVFSSNHIVVGPNRKEELLFT